MCTVTFWPRHGGYRLAMNRDEQWTRPESRPPSMLMAGERRLLLPSEAGGGTWIGVRNGATAFALVNWYACPNSPSPAVSTRGQVVPLLLTQCDDEGSCPALAELCHSGLRPFRVTGFFPRFKRVKEWQWNGHTLSAQIHPWTARQWISSGLNEPEAQRIRSAEFEQRRKEADAGRLRWLRSLHGSHAPDRGAFSHCVHRQDAGTVSYTEVTVTAFRAAMFHRPGCPCLGGRGTWHRLGPTAEGSRPRA